MHRSRCAWEGCMYSNMFVVRRARQEGPHARADDQFSRFPGSELITHHSVVQVYRDMTLDGANYPAEPSRTSCMVAPRV